MNLKNKSHKTVQQFLALFVFGLTLFTCVGPEEPYEYDPPATEILRDRKSTRLNSSHT